MRDNEIRSEPAIFTTRGSLPPERVRLVESITEDDDKIVKRVDKYDTLDNAWIGNDLHVHLKHPLPLFGIAQPIA